MAYLFMYIKNQKIRIDLFFTAAILTRNSRLNIGASNATSQVLFYSGQNESRYGTCPW